MIEAPQFFVVREECEKAAWQHGFRRKLGMTEGWAAFGSTTVPGAIHLAASGCRAVVPRAGPYGGHRGAKLACSWNAGAGSSRYAFDTLGELYGARRIYQLAASLPDAPLQEFQSRSRICRRPQRPSD